MMDSSSLAYKKWMVVALLWGSHVITFVIRISLGVVAPTLISLYGISPTSMGLILSGYSWFYMACLLPIGFIADRFGPFLVMGMGSLLWGLATIAFPLVTVGVFFFLMRGLFGAGHSMMIPAGANALSHWVDRDQRALAVGLTFAGGTMGLAIGSPTAAFLLDRFGWQSVFYGVGTASLLFSLAWFVLYPKERLGPETAQEQEKKPETQEDRVGWGALLRHRTTWGIALGQVGYLYGYFFFMTWLPGYLVMERHMSILTTGWVASLPFLMGMAGTIGGGFLGDFLIRQGVNPTLARKAIIGSGLTGAMIMIVAAAFTEETWLAVVLLTLCMGSLRLTTASSNSIPIDLAPPQATASLAAIQSLGGNTGGLIAPILTGYIVDVTGSFQMALIVAGAMALMSACSYVFLVGRIEPWQLPSTETSADF
jgi:MFS family permease